MDEREKAKLADLEAAGTRMTQRHLQRLRQAYRDEGLIGLADKRTLRSQTPGADADPRVIEAIEKMLADPGGRSTHAPAADATSRSTRSGRSGRSATAATAPSSAPRQNAPAAASPIR